MMKAIHGVWSLGLLTLSFACSSESERAAGGAMVPAGESETALSARSEDVVHTASGALRGRPRWEAWDARAATPYVQSSRPTPWPPSTTSPSTTAPSGTPSSPRPPDPLHPSHRGGRERPVRRLAGDMSPRAYRRQSEATPPIIAANICLTRGGMHVRAYRARDRQRACCCALGSTARQFGVSRLSWRRRPPPRGSKPRSFASRSMTNVALPYRDLHPRHRGFPAIQTDPSG
jgi:hypothetical protein